MRIAVPGREREQGRFRGSTGGVGGSIEGAQGASKEYGGAPGEQGQSSEGALHGSARQCRGEAGGIRFRLPPSRLELPFMLFYCLDSATSNGVLL